MNRYKFDKKLGTGAFGTVNLCRHRDNNQLVAQKEIKIAGLKKEEIKRLLQEVKVMEKFRESPHRNIIDGKGYVHMDDILCIYMEYCERGSLAAEIERRQSEDEFYDEKTILDYSHQIAAGLDHMHQHLVIHRDLKPANILITSDGVLKLADFGLGALLSSESSIRASFVGTPLYMAPEIINEEEYKLSCDIWAFGTILYELMALKPAFMARNQPAVMRKIIGGNFNPLEGSAYSEPLKRLVSLTLVVDASKRPDIGSIVALTFLSNRKVNSSSMKELEELEIQDVTRKMENVRVSPAKPAKKAEKDTPPAVERPFEPDLKIKTRTLTAEEKKIVEEYERGASGWGSALHKASYEGKTDVATLLIQNGAEVNAKDSVGDTPLHGASINGKTDVVTLLIQNGADIHSKDNNGWTPLHRVIDNGETDVVTLLIQNGADIHSKVTDGWTPLHWASYKGYTPIVESLIKAGADVNAKNNNGWTPLHTASRNGKAATAEVLIKAGASVNAKTEEDVGSILGNIPAAPLHIASFMGQAGTAEVLIKAGANVNAKTDKEWNGFPVGSTPLHMASKMGEAETAEVLIKAGATVNAKDKNGNTPLHMASEMALYYPRCKDVISLLLRNNADKNIKNNSGQTPKDVASTDEARRLFD